VADRLAGTLRGRGDQRRGAVEAREPAFGEPAGVADLDQQLGIDTVDSPGTCSSVLPLACTRAASWRVIAFCCWSSLATSAR
jgi:hypothetical protein